jgi:hypothetical protein
MHGANMKIECDYLRSIHVAEEDRGEMKHYGRNGGYIVIHTNRKRGQ